MGKLMDTLEKRAEWEMFLRRRIMKVSVSPDILADMFKQGSRLTTVKKGMPRDAQFVGVTHDFTSNQINLFYRHQSFEVVPDGQIPPEIIVMLEDIQSAEA